MFLQKHTFLQLTRAVTRHLSKSRWICMCHRNQLQYTKINQYLHTRWTPTRYKWSSNSYKYGSNPSYPFIKPFVGVITPFITIRGPPCTFAGAFAIDKQRCSLQCQRGFKKHNLSFTEIASLKLTACL